MSRHNRYNNQYQPQAEKPPTAYDKLKPYLTRTNIAVSAFMLIAIISFGLLYIQGISINCQNPISYYLYCNTIPSYEMNAMTWISQTIGSNTLPYKNIILSWWDYGDWINYFGHAGTVLRGDNQLPNLNYQTAYEFVDGNQTQLYDFMNQTGANYLMFEVGLLPKWSALNYLSCIYQNETTFNTPVGSSPCEARNMPTYIFFPAQLNNLNAYCSISNINNTYIKAVSNNGEEYCLQTTVPSGSNQAEIDGHIYSANGTDISYLNLIPVGQQAINNVNYDVYMLLYVPNSACSYPASENVPQFYKSNYYLMFDEGCWNPSLFKQVYPVPVNGVNGTGQVRIWEKI